MWQIALGFLRGKNVLLYVGVGILALSFFVYIKSLTSSVAELEANNALLEQINKEQALHMQELVEHQRQTEERMRELREDLTEIRQDNRELRDKLVEHDLKELAKRKPGLIEKAINDGTEEVIDELNEITSTE